MSEHNAETPAAQPPVPPTPEATPIEPAAPDLDWIKTMETREGGTPPGNEQRG